MALGLFTKEQNSLHPIQAHTLETTHLGSILPGIANVSLWALATWKWILTKCRTLVASERFGDGLLGLSCKSVPARVCACVRACVYVCVHAFENNY